MSPDTPGYVYVWEYVVRADRIAEFEDAYGPDGAWVELFRRADGFVRTELYRDRDQPGRYVTIDYWESLGAWEAFRTAAAEELEALDAKCEELTFEERQIARLDPVS